MLKIPFEREFSVNMNSLTHHYSLNSAYTIRVKPSVSFFFFRVNMYVPDTPVVRTSQDDDTSFTS